MTDTEGAGASDAFQGLTVALHWPPPSRDNEPCGQAVFYEQSQTSLQRLSQVALQRRGNQGADVVT
jgi:hypothetical protein